jgi:phosphatidate phosphatase PAH1
MRDLKYAFPLSINPFVGGLGNRDNDAIAYRSAGIDM